MQEPQKLVDLPPSEWTRADGRITRSEPRYTFKVFLVAFALSALYNWPSIVKAFHTVTAEHVSLPPGNYVWTPENGLQPTDSPATQPPR